MVKGRFQGLREIRIHISNEKDLEEAIKFIYCGYILQNILLDMTDDFWDKIDDVEGTLQLAREYSTGEQADERETDLSLTSDLTLTASGPQFREFVKEAVLRHNGKWDPTVVGVVE